jgi:tripartite-type tricarboxylate transporter receptor subunit TctC
MKANDGKVTAGSVGAGGSSAICSYYFGKVTGAKSTLVPYRGGAPALQDIVAGNVDTMCDLAANSLSQVQAGTIKAYAVAAKKRWFAAPDVPTVDEAGAPGVEVTNWLGAYAPKGTPKEIVAKLNAAFNAAMADAHVRERLAAQGLEPPAPERQTPEAFAAFLKAEMDKWGAVIRESGIKVQ